MPPSRPLRDSSLLRYGLALGTVVIAAALRIAIAPVIGDRNELLCFYPAIMIAAWFGGLGPGLVSTALSAIVVDFLFIDPRGTLAVTERSDAVALALFVLVGALIATLNDNLRRAISLEQQARRAAERAEAAADAANRSKDFFLAAVSHDLRTPTTAIVGWARMLESGVLDVVKQRHAAESIQRNAAWQITLLEDLLDTAAILAGGLRITTATVDLDAIVGAAVDDLQAAASAKRISVHLRRAPQPPLVDGDAMRIQQVVWNLLTNAVKFTPEGGAIHVAIADAGRDAMVEVRDTGPGIPSDMLPHVFDRYWQAERRSSGGHGFGVGLGLAIAKHLVEAHQGTIAVTSPAEGGGTTFTVRLPRHASASATVSVVQASG